jgi:HSP20 family protein
MTMERWRPTRGLIPWSPFREIEEMERRFDEVFGHSLLPSIWRRLPMEQMAWAPAIDVFEKGDKLVVKAEVPGMKEDDIHVSVEGDMLTIRGEKKTESEVKEEDYYRSERSYGSFFRSVALPSTVDASKIEADYENGVLEVTLPKKPEVKPKKVAVKKKEKANKQPAKSK